MLTSQMSVNIRNMTAACCLDASVAFLKKKKTLDVSSAEKKHENMKNRACFSGLPRKNIRARLIATTCIYVHIYSKYIFFAHWTNQLSASGRSIDALITAELWQIIAERCMLYKGEDASRASRSKRKQDSCSTRTHLQLMVLCSRTAGSAASWNQNLPSETSRSRPPSLLTDPSAQKKQEVVEADPAPPSAPLGETSKTHWDATI